MPEFIFLAGFVVILTYLIYSTFSKPISSLLHPKRKKIRLRATIGRGFETYIRYELREDALDMYCYREGSDLLKVYLNRDKTVDKVRSGTSIYETWDYL